MKTWENVGTLYCKAVQGEQFRYGECPILDDNLTFTMRIVFPDGTIHLMGKTYCILAPEDIKPEEGARIQVGYYWWYRLDQLVGAFAIIDGIYYPLKKVHQHEAETKSQV